ncbi:MBL fold metallo-hydrolase RNA specificity domain-containing protein [Calycomorphotria hydatis]|uniref:Ribonuclease n=1 Tax=Calycomorphotria hydatis TaxID=2528027 RepID=A0A517TBP2_9PLAN|nr:MBL fold metallo-hydrolase [Calycomorphotria hydatis]QDT65794.1 Ribonuclease [Calycomorphotria hydatis]
MKLTFLGAAGEVTGSQHLIETDELRVLLDCGLFQGRRAEADQKNRQFQCDPRTLDAVFLSHAHIDHCGNLPGLYKAGFRGNVFCTRATYDIAALMLMDSAKIQEEDAEYMSHRRGKHAPPIEPLYTKNHVREVLDLFEPLEMHQWHELSPALSVRFSTAGHILGSAITELAFDERGRKTKVAFTGDLGRRGMPLLNDPEIIDGADLLISECTYGNRIHPPLADLKSELFRILTEAHTNAAKVIIPAFSLGRTQQIVYFLNELWETDLLPRIPVYVDSPLATRLTNVYRDHQTSFDDEAQQVLITDDDLFEFEGLTYVRSRHESIRLNKQDGPFVVISASGMCESGRVRHHLKNAISDPRNVILLTGYQAPHTLGRKLQERQPKVRIFNREYEVKCKVEQVHGLSAHADAEELKWWFEGVSNAGSIGQCVLVHGEPDVAKNFAALVAHCCDEWPVVAERGQSLDI